MNLASAYLTERKMTNASRNTVSPPGLTGGCWVRLRERVRVRDTIRHSFYAMDMLEPTSYIC